MPHSLIHLIKPVYVLRAEFKRAVTLHLVTAFFLFGKDGQAVRRYPESCHPAFIWFSVLAKPYHPDRIIILFRKTNFFHAVSMEQLPYRVDDVPRSSLILPLKSTASDGKLPFPPLSCKERIRVSGWIQKSQSNTSSSSRVVWISPPKQDRNRHLPFFCFIAVFCRYRVSALEGIPYSYVISFHDSFHLIVDTRFIARKDYRIFNIALKACGSSL